MTKPKGIDGLFNGRYFDREVIFLCVRWYLRYKLSLRDLAEMMTERGLSLAHTTIMRWVKCYTPEFDQTGSSAHQIADERDARVQTLPQRGRYHLQHRADASHSQRSI